MKFTTAYYPNDEPEEIPGPTLLCECGSEAVLELDTAVYESCSWIHIYVRCRNFGCGIKTKVYES